LKQFGSIESIKKVGIDELQKSVGNHKARLIQQYFSQV
jgi:ERCC4-type nuclease